MIDRLNCKRCLLIEDDEVTAFLSMRVLKESNSFSEITHAPNGEMALEHCSNAVYDLIILDFSLPGIDGGEFITRYHDRCIENGKLPARIIIVSSSENLVEYDALLERDEVLGVLRKPLRTEHLMKMCSDCFLS